MRIVRAFNIKAMLVTYKVTFISWSQNLWQKPYSLKLKLLQVVGTYEVGRKVWGAYCQRFVIVLIVGRLRSGFWHSDDSDNQNKKEG